METTGKNNNETMRMDDSFCLGGQTFSSRLLTGTGKFASREIIAPMLNGCGSEIITVALRLQDAGAAAVMPLGSPIGSNRGIKMEEMIRIIIESMDIPVIVDAGIGRPSQAAQAMEMGADAVLVNTAIATSLDPVMAARAFAMGVAAGRMAFCADMAGETNQAQASSPLTGFLKETA